MKYIYLFTGVLVYIQLHIQVWGYLKKHGGRRVWQALVQDFGEGVWLLGMVFFSLDIFMVLSVLDKCRKNLFNTLTDLEWAYILNGWAVITFSLFQVLLWYILYMLLKRMKENTSETININRCKLIFAVILGNIILGAAIYMAMGGDISPFIDGIAWHIYKLLLFLGIVDH